MRPMVRTDAEPGRPVHVGAVEDQLAESGSRSASAKARLSG